MKNDEIILRIIHKSIKQPKGGFEAYYYNSEGKGRSKQCGLHINEPDIAYDTVDLWAQDKAKELGLKYIKVTQAELQRRINVGRVTEKKITNGISTSINRSILSNKIYFKAEIKKVFEALGHERLTEIFKVGRDHLNSLERDRNKIAQNTGKAKANMAKSMYDSFIETGIDTSIYCNDEEILIIFNALKEVQNKLI